MTFLVIQAARFGDLIQTKRLILTLASRGCVHLCVDASLAKLARHIYPMAEIFGINIHCPPNADAWDENLRVFAKLRSNAYEAIYNCNFSRITAAICRMFDSEQIVGYRATSTSETGIIQSAWTRLAFRLSQHRPLTSLNLVDFWANFAQDPLDPQMVNEPARPRDGGLGIALAGRDARRSLPAPVLSKIITVIFECMGGTPITLLGSSAESKIARKLMHELSPKIHPYVTDLSGKTDWDGLIAAVGNLRLLLTPDTGIMHLAAHLAVPTMSFFLSSAWCHETGPYGLGHTVWQTQFDCSPCIEAHPCPHKTCCLDPYTETSFLKALASTVTNKSESLSLSQNLHKYMTDFDDFGLFFRDIANNDQLTKKRFFVRRIVKSFLGLHSPAMNHGCSIDTVQQKHLLEWLVDDREWMLPPKRYC